MRNFTPYEQNHLRQYGFSPETVALTADAEIPVEYITGKVNFLGTTFNITQDVLIPRIESEELIGYALDYIKLLPTFGEKIIFADVGCGSGVLGLALAFELDERSIPFDGFLSDINPKAITVAQENSKLFAKEGNVSCFIFKNLQSSVTIFQSNLLENYPSSQKLDIVLANLPYVPSGRIKQLPPSVQNYEPHQALDGGPDGLKYIRTLLKEASNLLKKEGIVLLEVDDTHTDTSEFSDVWIIDCAEDQNGKNRFWICKLK